MWAARQCLDCQQSPSWILIVEEANVAAARRAMVAAGYHDCGEMNVPGCFAFRQPGLGPRDAAWGEPRNGELRQNTYVMKRGYQAPKNHLDVKTTLLNDDSLRDEYAKVKMKLSERDFADIGEYVTAKNDIICKIWSRAGWCEEDVQVIRSINSKPRPGGWRSV